jgi:hypothetical protein
MARNKRKTPGINELFFYNDGKPNDPTKGCAISLYNIITRRIPVHFMHELDLHVIVSVHVKTGQAHAIIQ